MSKSVYIIVMQLPGIDTAEWKEYHKRGHGFYTMAVASEEPRAYEVMYDLLERYWPGMWTFARNDEQIIHVMSLDRPGEAILAYIRRMTLIE